MAESGGDGGQPRTVVATPIPPSVIASVPTMSAVQQQFMEMRMRQALGKSGIPEPQSLPVQMLMRYPNLQQAASSTTGLIATVNSRPRPSGNMQLLRGLDVQQMHKHPLCASAAAATTTSRLMHDREYAAQMQPRHRAAVVARPSTVIAARIASAFSSDASSNAADLFGGVSYAASGLGLQRATVREAARFNITACTANGQKSSIGPSTDFFVQVRGVARVRARIVAGGKDESFMTIEWKPTCSGQYHIVVSRLGVPIVGSPFSVHATDAEPHAPQCAVRGAALANAVSRDMNHFEVEFKDKLGCVTHAVELDVFVEPLPQDSPRASPQGRPAVLTGGQQQKERESPAPSMRDHPQHPKGRGDDHEQEDPNGDYELDIDEAPEDVRERLGTASGRHWQRLGDTAPSQGIELQHEELSLALQKTTKFTRAQWEEFDIHHLRPDHYVKSRTSYFAPVATGGVELAAMAAVAVRRRGGMARLTAQNDAFETRYRRIRVRVADKPLVVRAGPELDSEQIGQLLPGAIATVLEERITPGNVRAMISLESLGKEDSEGIKRTGLTFRSENNTFRSDGIAIPSPPLPRKSSAKAATESARKLAVSDDSGSQRSQRKGGGGGAPSYREGSGSHRSASSHRKSGGKAASRKWNVSEAGAGSHRVAASCHRSSGSDAESSQPSATNLSSSSPSLSTKEADRSALGLASIGEEAEEEEEEEYVEPDVHAATPPKLGAGHERVKQLWGMKLPSSPKQSSGANDHPMAQPLSPLLLSERPTATPPRTPPKAFHERLNWGLRQSSERGGLSGETSEDADLLSGKVGWITLIKDGKKLVTSRLRLDAISKHEQVDQWKRRLRNNNSSTAAALAKKGVPLRESERNMLAGNGPTLPIAIELADDPASFAYGGLFPGTVHSHGKLHDVHRVSYSIGVSGQYLLHVRLRKQAVALPGSPFDLRVEAGPSYALSSRLPLEALSQEVGVECAVIVTTADRMGNPRFTGGDKARFLLTCDSRTCSSSIDDIGDGSYKLRWLSDVPGTYVVHVKIDQEDIVNSPKRITFASTIPVLENSELIFREPNLDVLAGQSISFQIKLFDQFGNPSHPSEAYKTDVWDLGLTLLNTDDLRNLSENEPLPGTQHQSRWLPEGNVFEITFTPMVAGEHELHVYSSQAPDANAATEAEKNQRRNTGDKKENAKKEEAAKREEASSPEKKSSSSSKKSSLSRYAAEKRSRNNGNRHPFPGSPFMIQVGRSSNEVTQQRGGTAAGDYAIERTVFEEAQRTWATFTVDAFSSEASAMVSRYWTKTKSLGAEGNDSLHVDRWRNVWGAGEVVWAHPPIELLVPLTQVLVRHDRYAETVVCCPLWSSAKWFRELESIADDQFRYSAGKLHKVADDAPARCEEWPVMLFHIPAQDPPRSLTGARRPSMELLSPDASPSHSPQPSSPVPNVPNLNIQSGGRVVQSTKEAW